MTRSATDKKSIPNSSSEQTKRAEFLAAARERTRLEVAKKAVDLGSKPYTRTTLAALAAAGLLPALDAANILEQLSNATNLPHPEASQIRPRRRY